MATQHGDLELDGDISFQRRQWRVQRIGWAIFMLVIALALLGIFGSGPLSDATVSAPNDSLSIDYRRFVRQDAPAKLTFQVAPDQIDDGMVNVWIDSDYLHGVDIESISPEPSEVRIGEDRQLYQFAVDNSALPFRITFSLRPQEVGVLSAHVGLADHPELEFRQISYP